MRIYRIYLQYSHLAKQLYLSLRGDENMYALLILNEEKGNVKVIVELKKKPVEDKVNSLLENNNTREAFDLLKDQAEVYAYLPAGARISRMPQVTLVEDLL